MAGVSGNLFVTFIAPNFGYALYVGHLKTFFVAQQNQRPERLAVFPIQAALPFFNFIRPGDGLADLPGQVGFAGPFERPAPFFGDVA
jgi:hypothetical protein